VKVLSHAGLACATAIDALHIASAATEVLLKILAISASK
jgi:hypothetical protein